MSIILRNATRADQTAIKAIVRAAQINPTGLNWQRFIVAVDGDKLVALGQVKPHRDGSRELASIATIPERQRHGLSRQIIEALPAREHGDLYLMCRAPLVAFYERFGFHRALPAELPPLFRLADKATRFWGGAVMKRPAPVTPKGENT